MASPDGATTGQFRNLTDVRVALVAGVCAIALTPSLEYGTDIEMPFVYHLSPLAPYFTHVFSHGAALFTQTWMVLIVVITLGTFDFFMFQPPAVRPDLTRLDPTRLAADAALRRRRDWYRR